MDDKLDLIECECGIQLWKGSRCKPCDLLSHLSSDLHVKNVTVKQHI